LGYTPIGGALKNLRHRVARSTVATIRKEECIPPSDERPTSWQAFMRAHWNAFMAADFFTTEVWTVRGLITYYTVFVCNAHAERFVRSVKEECLNRRISLGEWHLRRALSEFLVHYHRQRNHQGLGNELIDGVEKPTSRPPRAASSAASIGLLNYYYRAE
jgi:hypothetical protein